MRKIISCVFLGLPLLLGGCVPPPPSGGAEVREDKSWQPEVERLRAEQAALAKRVQQLADNLLLFEGRLQDQQLLLRDLRAMATAQKVTPGGEKTGGLSPAPAIKPPGAAEAKPAAATEVYLQAFADFASGHYPQAISGFENFLRLYPGNDYAGHALYWLGECYYAQKQYAAAVDAFRRTVEQFPQGGKAPEALRQMAGALLQMDRRAEAEEVLKLLRERYPESAAARRPLEKSE